MKDSILTTIRSSHPNHPLYGLEIPQGFKEQPDTNNNDDSLIAQPIGEAILHKSENDRDLQILQ